jgi:hypothetical protein
MISIDFETRSKTDLIAEGVYNYASCPTTEVICMAYSVNNAPPALWVPDSDAQQVRYCKKMETGEIVVVDIHSRCPDGYWEVR